MKIAAVILSLVMSVSVWASKVEVDVTGMSCGMCVEGITSKLKETEKVENIKVSLEDKKVTFDEIKGKKISEAEIKTVIKRAGDNYEAVKVRRRQ